MFIINSYNKYTLYIHIFIHILCINQYKCEAINIVIYLLIQ